MSKSISQYDYEMVGRFISNSFGVQEKIIMPQYDWAYLDWLISIGANLQEIMLVCDTTYPEIKPNADLTIKLRWWLNEAYWLRKEKGLSQPPWLRD
jgi:hypothetical protein